jgi:hypothetical protein
LDIQKLYVKLANGWIPLRSWIQTLLVQSTGHEGWAAQARWWNRNGKIFRLMELPPELRIIIFKYVLGPDIYLLSTVNSNKLFNRTSCSRAHAVFGLGYNESLLDRFKHHRRIFGMTMKPLFSDDPTRVGGQPPIPPPSLEILRVSKKVHTEAMESGWRDTWKCFRGQEQLQTVWAARQGANVNYNWLRRVDLTLTNDDWFYFFGICL